MDVRPNQSLINEYKGNLFEYLVAQSIAKKLGIEKEFLLTVDLNLKNYLTQYQEKLRKLDPQLIEALPLLAKETGDSIIEFLSFTPGKIKLIGKLGAHPNSEFSEVDLLLSNDQERLPISLKLSKKGTATHTKSAGLKSVFKKYFQSEEIQISFNQYLEIVYAKMAANIHELEDITYTNGFSEWTKRGLTEYPGELKTEQKEVLTKCYYELISRVYKELNTLNNKNPKEILKGFYMLMGFQSLDLVQVKCLYEHKDNRYQYHETEFLKPTFKEDSVVKINSPKIEQASFLINIGNEKLQLRIKPMNKFTVPGFKLNCALIS